MALPDLYWLPAPEGFDAALAALKDDGGDPAARIAAFAAAANTALDFMQTGRLDRAFQRVVRAAAERGAPISHLKLAILASSTVDHLLPAIRMGALRRGLVIEIHLAPYGQYVQELLDPNSGLHRFDPDVVMFSLDHQAMVGALPLGMNAADVRDAIDARVDELRRLWRHARDSFKCAVIQQLVLNRGLALFGNYEASVAAAPGGIARRLNLALADAASEDGVLPLDVDRIAGQLGLKTISDPMLWHHAKQEISPAVSPLIGDLVGRQLAAIRGLSKKCLVLDLDNTIWGGVVGDDGLDGIVLGQGSAAGEAFAAFQAYARQLSERGIVLAVSSKNEAGIVEDAFERHPEMVLRRSDIAVLEANWEPKPTALQRIAGALDLGIDSLVFFDDNPAERSLMRETLPMVAVPEVPASPEAYAQCLADAGYFEAVAFTAEDTRRSGQYVANQRRKEVQSSAADMDSFLRNLEMEIQIKPFDKANLPRVAQLVNKTNQFNLTTRRYTEAEAEALMADSLIETRYVRLKDRFGDNGIISVVIGRIGEHDGRRVLDIDTWLMSCRVLGRRVENAVLDDLVHAARRNAAGAIIGRYVPTARNAMVREHYKALGFDPVSGGEAAEDGTYWILDVDRHERLGEDLFKMVQENE